MSSLKNFLSWFEGQSIGRETAIILATFSLVGVGFLTLILPEITNDVSIELLYLLNQFYKTIHFCTKSMEEITCGQYNIRIITCKYFKGITLTEIYKILAIIQQWEKIDTSNGAVTSAFNCVPCSL